MKKRTHARELALKALYQHDLLGLSGSKRLKAFCEAGGGAEVVAFAMALVEGCIATAQELDSAIEQSAENWRLDRMAIIDRNILRLGAYELLFTKETPPKVAINEAIELAKKFSTEDSPNFVNGILDRIYTNLSAGRQTGSGLSADKGGRADLHVHSTASDGSVAPAQVAELAAEAGLVAFALTDHDSVGGIAPARSAAEQLGIQLIEGVELTAYAGPQDAETDTEVHILGLFVDGNHEPLLRRLQQLRERRVERVVEMCAKLSGLGFNIESGAVLRRSAGGAVGRVHLAQEMVERGMCEDVGDAFDRYIGSGRPACVPKQKLTPEQTIEMVKDAGGCTVFAHPDISSGAVELITGLAGKGLDAVEVRCPPCSEGDKKELLALTKKLGLAVSAGSDFHGSPKPDISVGQEWVSTEEMELLRRRAGVRV